MNEWKIQEAHGKYVCFLQSRRYDCLLFDNTANTPNLSHAFNRLQQTNNEHIVKPKQHKLTYVNQHEVFAVALASKPAVKPLTSSCVVDDELFLKLAVNIASAIQALHHEARLAHRGLGPSVVLFEQSSNEFYLNLSKYITLSDEPDALETSFYDSKEMEFAAPEVKRGSHVHDWCKADVFSFGSILLHVLAGTIGSRDDRHTMALKILDSQESNLSSALRDHLRDILPEMLHADAKARSPIARVCKGFEDLLQGVMRVELIPSFHQYFVYNTESSQVSYLQLFQHQNLLENPPNDYIILGPSNDQDNTKFLSLSSQSSIQNVFLICPNQIEDSDGLNYFDSKTFDDDPEKFAKRLEVLINCAQNAVSKATIQYQTVHDKLTNYRTILACIPETNETEKLKKMLAIHSESFEETFGEGGFDSDQYEKQLTCTKLLSKFKSQISSRLSSSTALIHRLQDGLQWPELHQTLHELKNLFVHIQKMFLIDSQLERDFESPTRTDTASFFAETYHDDLQAQQLKQTRIEVMTKETEVNKLRTENIQLKRQLERATAELAKSENMCKRLKEQFKRMRRGNDPQRQSSVTDHEQPKVTDSVLKGSKTIVDTSDEVEDRQEDEPVQDQQEDEPVQDQQEDEPVQDQQEDEPVQDQQDEPVQDQQQNDTVALQKTGVMALDDSSDEEDDDQHEIDDSPKEDNPLIQNLTDSVLPAVLEQWVQEQERLHDIYIERKPDLDYADSDIGKYILFRWLEDSLDDNFVSEIFDEDGCFECSSEKTEENTNVIGYGKLNSPEEVVDAVFSSIPNTILDEESDA